MPSRGGNKSAARGKSQARHHRGGGKDKTVYTDSKDHGRPVSAIVNDEHGLMAESCACSPSPQFAYMPAALKLPGCPMPLP